MIARLIAIQIAIGLLLFTGCAQKPMIAPSVAAVTGAVTKAKTTVTTAQESNKSAQHYNALAKANADKVAAWTQTEEQKKIANDLIFDLEAEKTAHGIVETALGNTMLALSDANDKAQTLQEAINVQADRANKAIADYQRAVHQYHLVKLILAAAVAVAVALLVFLFGSFIPPPLNLYLGAGGAIAAAAAVWFFL